jgi:hypothetical protein
LLSKEERMANLKRASAMTRVQDNQIQNTLNGMSNEEVENFISNNPEYAEMLSVSADSDNSGIVINYANQPNNQHEAISISPPWEANFAAGGQPQGRVNLFQVGSNPSTGMSFNNNGFYNNYYGYGMNPNDERLKQYTPGMKLYGINPYSFPNATQMVNYFDYCEQQREFADNQKYGWALLSARMVGTDEALKWAESFKFKPADQIYKEQQEAQAKAQQEKMQSMTDDGNNVVYDVYDCRGIRFQRACNFKIIDIATGDIVREVNHERDALGQAYTTHTQIDDRKEQYEIQQMYAQIAYYNKYVNTFRNLFNKSYVDNINRWNSWKAAGLSIDEQFARWEDERIDWKKHERLIQRALQTASFSRENFRDILSSCCHTELDYANRSNFFSLSYDFERDLHYKSLISTPQEMNNDPLVHQKLQQEYDIKRKLFMDKVMSGNLGSATAPDAHYHPTFAKTPVEQLTLEDYNKPENQFMYTKTVTPELATENLFIPKNMTGGIVPEQRTFGIMTVDDDTGEIISQHEEDVTSESGFSSPVQLTDEEMEAYF